MGIILKLIFIMIMFINNSYHVLNSCYIPDASYIYIYGTINPYYNLVRPILITLLFKWEKEK